MRRVGDDYLFTKRSLIGLVVCIAALIFSVAAVGYNIFAISNQADRSTRLICTLNRLFGLDVGVDPKVLQQLTRSQRLAIAVLANSCPVHHRRKP